MSRVYRSSDKEVNIGIFFKQHPAYHRGAVAAYPPFIIELIFRECVMCVFDYLVDSDNAFGDKIDAFDLCGRRYVALKEVEACLDFLTEKSCGDRPGFIVLRIPPVVGKKHARLSGVLSVSCSSSMCSASSHSVSYSNVSTASTIPS